MAEETVKTDHYNKNEQPDATYHNDDKADQGKSAGVNQATNANSEAASSEESLEIMLVGFPRLKAKICINVLNIGPDASGKWYVKTVEQGWSTQYGYLTRALCSRGTGGDGGSPPGVGSGGPGGPLTTSSNNTTKKIEEKKKPVQVYAEIDKPKTIYVGPRKCDGAAQHTFTWGNGEWMHSYLYSDNAQKSKKGGGSATLSGHQRDKKGENTVTKPSSKKG